MNLFDSNSAAPLPMGSDDPPMRDELTFAVELILSLYADPDYRPLDNGEAEGAVDIYTLALDEIATVADRYGEPALAAANRYLAEELSELRRQGHGARIFEAAAFRQWPHALLNYIDTPDDGSTAASLIDHLRDSVLPAPMTEHQRHELIAALQHAAPASTGTSPTEPNADGAGATAPSPTAVQANAASVAAIDEVLAQAEGRDLLGLQEVCLRLRGNIDTLLAAGGELRGNIASALGRFPELAQSYLDSPNTETSTRLVAYLGEEIWPERPDTYEAEGLQFILDAGSQFGSVDDETATRQHDIATASPTPTPAPSVAAQSVTIELQCVNEELLSLLAGELVGMQSELAHLGAEIASPNAPTGAGQTAAASYAENIERLALAAETVGLKALHDFLGLLHERLVHGTTDRYTTRQREVFALLPGSLLAYLAAPTDPSTGEGLVDLLRGDTWEPTFDAASATALARTLSMVELTAEKLDTEQRQTTASPEDVSLQLPSDLNQELLDGLLQELPLHTSDFSAAIQRLSSGAGTFADIEVAKRAAHTLKGAANTVGVKGIANLTHHTEDILVALAKYQRFPNRALADTLINVADCLEAMGEAVMGTGPAPDYAQSVLQQVLDWANRIDSDGVPVTDGPVMATTTDTSDEPSEHGAPTPPPAQPTEAMVRVPAGLIDELLRLMGETIISTGQVRERLRRLANQNVAIRRQNNVLLNLATELEERVDLRGVAKAFGASAEDGQFDPLEFEQYNEIHTISRRLIEAATDSGELSGDVETELSDLNELIDAQNRLHTQSQNTVMRTRMVPVATIVSRLQRSVRQAARLLDKQVQLDVAGTDTMVDSNILGELVDPLMHILRNAVDHGIETSGERTAAGKDAEGRIELKFFRQGNNVVVRCRDDGAGLDLAAIRRTAEARGLVTPGQAHTDDELARLILAPGFSTRSESTQISGRGIGMDVVHTRVLQLKGTVTLDSRRGDGLEIELRLPATLIATHALLVRSRGQVLAVSSYGIQDIHYLQDEQLQQVGGQSYFRLNEDIYPLVHLDILLDLPPDSRREERGSGFPVLLVRLDTGTTQAVRVQEIIDSTELVVKNLGHYVPKPPGIVGATILGDGSVAAVVDVPELMRKPVMQTVDNASVQGASGHDEIVSRGAERFTALVVDDSLSARRATAQFMKDAGFEVRTAIDGLEAVTILDKWKPDILLVDMEMPRMNGLELTAHVRARMGMTDLPVIMITSRSTEKHRRQAEAAGVDIYLTKPFSDDQLLQHVHHLTAA